VNPKVFFFIIAVVLVFNTWLSFHHAREAAQGRQALQVLLDFRDKGARYTYGDGVQDRADRDAEDVWLQEQINTLYNLCLGESAE
jgi:hypothetical protein